MVPAGTGAGCGSSCTGCVTGAGTVSSGVSSVCCRSPAISCRAENSRGDWLSVNTAAADRPSDWPGSPSCQRSRATGISRFSACHAPAASVLPAVTLTVHRVTPASSAAPSRREMRAGSFLCLMFFTSWDNLCCQNGKNAPEGNHGFSSGTFSPLYSARLRISAISAA